MLICFKQPVPDTMTSMVRLNIRSYSTT